MYVYVCMYVRVCIVTCMYVYVCTCMYVCMYVYVCMCMYVYVCMHVRVCMHVCIHIHVFIRVPALQDPMSIRACGRVAPQPEGDATRRDETMRNAAATLRNAVQSCQKVELSFGT